MKDYSFVGREELEKIDVEGVKRESLKSHAGDCAIYSALVNEQPKDGICNCGYGLKLSRRGDKSEMYSNELKERMKIQKDRWEALNYGISE